MDHSVANSLGDLNQGFQFGTNNGSINAELYLAPQRPETPPEPCSTVPFNRDQEFIDRGTLLSQVHEKRTQSARIALVGLGGVGKSQLLVEYSYRVREIDPKTWVFWIHASNPSRFEADYIALAETLKIPGRQMPNSNIFQLVRDWLQNERKGKWILVIDNLDEYFLDQPVPSHTTSSTESDGSGGGKRVRLDSFFSFLPRSRSGFTIITTRSKDVALKLVYDRDIILVEPMEQSQALALVERKLLDEAEIEDINQLTEKLDYMPLAISQAVAYLNKRGARCSVTQYLEEFGRNDRKRVRLLETEPSNPLRDHEAANSIMDTWQISFDHIRRIRPSAADVLSLASFCDRQGIPDTLLRINPVSDNDTDSIAGDEFEDDLQLLTDFLFLSQNSDGRTFEMHSLVQLATRAWLRNHGDLEKWKVQFIDNLAERILNREGVSLDECILFIPHAQSAFMQRPKTEDALKNWAILLHNAAYFLDEVAMYRDALEMRRVSFNTMQAILGPSNIDTLIIRSSMALSYRRLGLYEEVKPILKQVLEVSANVFGLEDSFTQDRIQEIVREFLLTEDYFEAEALFRKVESWSSDTESLPSSLVLHGISFLLIHQGKFEEAEEHLKNTLRIQEKFLPANHHLDAMMQNWCLLASAIAFQGRWNEAEEMMIQEIDVFKIHSESPYYLRLVMMMSLYLGRIYEAQERWLEAENLFQQALDISLKIFGPYNPQITEGIMFLGKNYLRTGLVQNAEALLNKWLNELLEVLGVSHPVIMEMMTDLAMAYQIQHCESEAKERVLQILNASKTMEGNEALSMYSLQMLKWVCSRQNLLEEVDALDIKILEKAERMYGPDHERARRNRANAYAKRWKSI